MPENCAVDSAAPFVQVLGIAQDGGYPQAGCQRPCCVGARENVEQRRAVAALGIVDPATGDGWLIDATPDFPGQLAALQQAGGTTLAGICLTHAHMGHYTGLIYLGKEAMAASKMPVFVMPRMQAFLQEHQPWSTLGTAGYVQWQELAAGRPLVLNDRIQVTPWVVPHRAEFSETVALVVSGPSRRVLWVPDIDGWDQGEVALETLLAEVDVAYLDGTFFDADELVGRSLEEVPHPTVSQTLERLGSLAEAERTKVRFVHLNHTNPLLDGTSPASQRVQQAGSHVARQGEQQGL
ncbi:MAG: MBL fold metallo-hydrolase [Pirellulaceae bacterium]